MTLLRSVGARCVRWRYVVLAVWAVPWVLAGSRTPRPAGDWLYVEVGARVLAQHHAPVGAGPMLHLYANYPLVQMGPPALWAAVPFQWLPPAVEEHLALTLLSFLVLPVLWCLELAARSLVDRRPLALRTLVCGAVAVPVWTLEIQTWGHIDDALALMAAAVAAVLVSRGRREIVAGLILGTAAAAKPWAVVLLPLVLAYPRPKVARAVLAFVVAALAWWLPFVLAAPATVHDLGSFSLAMANHPTWQLVGLAGGRAPTWIRALQMIGGIALAVAVLRRAGWPAVLLVALAWRVTTDPYDWPYYVMGPLVGAALWDLTRSWRGRLSTWPWATLATLLAESAIPRILPDAAPAVRFVWCVALTAVVLRAGRSCPKAETSETVLTDSRLRPDVALTH